jgi:hypothetical protein
VVVQLVWQLFNKIWANFVQSSGRTASKERCLKGLTQYGSAPCSYLVYFGIAYAQKWHKGTFIKHKNKLIEGSSEKAEHNKFLKIILKIFYCFDLS